MGREKKILLTMLCLLSGTFVGVLSAKLLVPRPPTGAGPDVHAGATATPTHELVEPPTLSERPTTMPAAGVDPEVGVSEPAAFAAAPDAVAIAARTPSRFATTAPPETAAVVPTAAVDEAPRAALVEPSSATGSDETVVLAGAEEPGEPLDSAPQAPPSPAEFALPAGGYVTVVGDSWWSLAERAYGDGRLYRGLFAWNRAIDPRVSLVPGTRLDLPSRQRLRAAVPHLIPDR